MQKSVKLYTENNILNDFYGRLNKANLSRNSQNAFSGMYLPHSDVFYVQEALKLRTNKHIPLREVELYMKETGWTPKEVV
jgi:hypothetical protein